MNGAPVIETENPTKRYGRHRGIDEITLFVQAGAWLFDRRDISA